MKVFETDIFAIPTLLSQVEQNRLQTRMSWFKH